MKGHLVYHAGDVHHVVVSFHGVPVMGEDMFITVALVLFFQYVILL
jgi:hypothetical protein